MDKRQVTKTVVRHLTRSSTAAATANIVAGNRNHSDSEIVDKYHETAAVVGGFAAGWMVGDYVATFAEVKVDELFDWAAKTFAKKN